MAMISENGQAGTEVSGIEVTPEMMAAGEARFDQLDGQATAYVVAEVYQAMARARHELCTGTGAYRSRTRG